MPYSFTQIEEDKSKTIGFVFSFLLLFYFVSLYLIVWVVYNYLNYQGLSDQEQLYFQIVFLSWPVVGFVFLLAAIVGATHWFVSVEGLIPKLKGVLSAESLNPNDIYHQRFQNIIDEVTVATGSKYKIEGVVIPTAALNAFALQSFDGKSVIGVTEGLLARLNRAQIEAVVGHEAAHIISGDCLATTVTTSLFALYGTILNGLEKVMRSENRYSSRRSNSGGLVVVLIVYLLLVVTRFVSNLARMFISREREFRADAIAVRLTRDPLSLAEALYSITGHWRGSGLASEELESIFIINPQYSSLDESSNMVSDLFSTHPPVKKRLKILLDMASVNANALEDAVLKNKNRPKTEIPEVSNSSSANQWMVNQDGNWQGPFDLKNIATLSGFNSDVWVKRVGDTEVKMAYQDDEIKNIVLNQNIVSGSLHCPRCQIPLRMIHYEGVEVQKCFSCKGTLVLENDIKRIIIREDVAFSDSVKKLAEVYQQSVGQLKPRDLNRDPSTLLPCPKCFSSNKSKMNRVFYTEVYRIEVDRCYFCQMYWFEKDELEVLQCLIERQAIEKSE